MCDITGSEPNTSHFGKYLSEGCDSGFGHKLALRLHALGCDVFAGCLFPDGEGAISLSKYQSERLKVVKLDVTKDEDVFAAVNYVTNNLRNNSLWALVNNAGVVHYAATEFGENGIGVFDETMRVNALGTVRVTKAFLPLLRKEKGSRAIFLSSIAGRVEFPTLTAYSMSKFAVNAFCNSLRREMKRFHVYVSIIEPTVYKTAMGDKKIILEDFRRIWEKTSDEVKEDYGHDGYRKNHDYVEALMDTRISNCDDVVDAIVEAIRRKEPRCVYRVGSFVVRATIEASTYFAEEFSDIVYSHHISMITLKLIAFVHRVLRI
ncbi:hypothetical protein B4U79_05873 [Dinothrombium tinctorium]|uniref:D-beta-hydroxybutyrate dehydrogenase-like protein n=1 Tax=Dinothrombium tinctorium TaxID=1965070 RepID=A0A3S3PQD7_9ACAR|nr:hypothetical protein B4U79_03605 [Dinothrombium tinctorium]RWS09432.1 hypothetical protein B4U79_05873 [Dinothrombium tinctorium]